VALTVSDPCGVASTCETQAHIGQNSPPGCDAGGPYAGVPGVAIVFDGTGSHDPDGVIVAYAWDFGDGRRRARRWRTSTPLPAPRRLPD
jgi:YD repeat-containing protein